MQNEIVYQKNEEMECIYYKNWNKSYPMHTHTSHRMLGSVEEGQVCIQQGEDTVIYSAGEEFCIFPNLPHKIETVGQKPYSMVVLCVKCEKNMQEEHLEILKENLLERAETLCLIGDMAEKIHLSPFYLIRQFKKAFGLTPHQFQLQCRVRKAQGLLEKGKSVTEAAYEAGFYDQSHFTRCFKKIVQLTPKQYKASLKLSAECWKEFGEQV